MNSESRSTTQSQECCRETLRFQEINSPGTYLWNETGNLLRLPEEVVKPGHSPIFEIATQGDDRVTKLSDNPYMPRSKARLLAADADLQVNF
jgi:hypothetical protein